MRKDRVEKIVEKRLRVKKETEGQKEISSEKGQRKIESTVD